MLAPETLLIAAKFDSGTAFAVEYMTIQKWDSRWGLT